jgi:membrane protease YdiL (CAAX protease family)
VPLPAVAAVEPFFLRTWWASGILFTAGLFFFFIFGQILPGIVLAVWIGVTKGFQSLQDQAAIMDELVKYMAVMIVFSPLASVTLLGGLKLARQLAPDPPTTSWWKTGLLTLATCVAAYLGCAAIAQWQAWIGFKVEEQEIMTKAFKGGPTLGLVLATVVYAPVGEELFFRRFGYGTLRLRYGRVFALLVTAALFALIHLNPPALLVYFWLGLCMAFVYEKTGRVSCAIAIHAFNNALAVFTNS